MTPDRPEGSDEGRIEAAMRAAAEPPARAAAGLLSFLFADIRGYTTFTQQQGDEAAARLTGKFAAVVRDLVTAFDGSVVELRGDEALCVFSSPRQSIRFAVALQQRFVQQTAEDATLPMTVGIGIDAGEAVQVEDGYRGGALNVAARLCGLAKAGEVLATAELTHLARRIEGITYTTLPSVVVKGIAEPVRISRVSPDGEDPADQLAALIARPSPTPAMVRTISWLPGPLRRRPGIAAGLAVAVVAAAVAGTVFATDDGAGTDQMLGSLRENSVGVVDPATGKFLAQVDVGAAPRAAASGFGSVWTANTDANTVSRIDIATRKVTQTIEVGEGPSAIAVGLGSVWVTNSNAGTVSRISPRANESHTIAVGAAPQGIIVARGSVWVTNFGDGTVARIDPGENEVVDTIEVGDGPHGIAASSDIWVANSGTNTVSQIDGDSHAVIATIHVGNDPKGVAVAGDSVWVTNNLDGTLGRIEVDRSAVAETVEVGAEPTDITATDGHLWLVTEGGQEIVDVDAATAQVVHRAQVGAIPGGVTAAGGQVWVTATINPGLHRGGTLRILAGDPGPADPTYFGNPAPFLGSYDGLVAFRQATGADGIAVVPDLATAIPEPIDGGRTYVFQVRAGIRFSTGEPVTVFDVRRGLQRAVVANVNPLRRQILGAQNCTPKRCDPAGIEVDEGARTVTIRLVRANPDFLEQIALGAGAVPADTPLGPQVDVPLPATGPYAVSTYVPHKRLVLTRNPHFRPWSAAAQPDGFPDRIEWQIDPKDDHMRAFDSVSAGDTDWADVSGAGDVNALRTRFGSQLHVGPTYLTVGVMLNTRVAPFDDPRVRQALAFAVDRAAVAEDWFVPISVTCQVLPPDFPGYRPYCPYTLRPDEFGTWHAPDLGTALELVARSHTEGMRVTLHTTPNQVAGLAHVVDALESLGYRATLKVVTDQTDYFKYIVDSRNRFQVGFFAWFAVVPQAADFLSQLFACDSFVPASPLNLNAAQFCDAPVDAIIERARRQSSAAEANAQWARADRRVVDLAPFIPLGNPNSVELTAKRVHNYQRTPMLGVLLSQMWLR